MRVDNNFNSVTTYQNKKNKKNQKRKTKVMNQVKSRPLREKKKSHKFYTKFRKCQC